MKYVWKKQNSLQPFRSVQGGNGGVQSTLFFGGYTQILHNKYR